MSTTDSLSDLVDRLDRFARVRDWPRFHSPKNLASALIVEAAELLEPFQWLTEAQSRELPPERRQAVAEECADVLLYLVQLSSALGIDLVAEAHRKVEINERRFPPEPA
jgi:NTP pyrophosphatase (non-canonical NTP hydrolase)